MKQLLPFALILPLFFAACKSKCIEDAGLRVSRVNTVDKFDEMEITGPIKVVLKQDNSYAITVEADSNIADQVKSSVSRGTLSLSLDPEKYCGTDSIVITTGIGQLKSVKADAASKLYASGPLNFSDLKLTLKGSTEVNLNLNAATLTTDLDGTSNIKLAGQAGKHDLKAKGTITLDAFDFVVGEYDINLEGAGKSNINVLNDLDVETSGSSEIFYKGSPKNISKKKAGNARLEKVN